MDLISTKSSSSASNVPHTLSLSAKMKRLKVEEHLLLQNIKKCLSDEAKNYSTFSEFKAFTGKNKNTLREIKLLFQDIKTSTSSKEMLETIDIEDVKKNTIELENRIKAFKFHLQSELARLSSEEQELNTTINEEPIIISKFKKQPRPRIQTAKYNEIVPSPVKTLMTSPFKCPEVQEFQDFMQNSVNRYGGWDEYHHNIFVNHWKKHFESQHEIVYDETNGQMEITPILNSFLRDLLPKLFDIREDEIISHIKWYSKFIYLKQRQQKAIDKWRSNRKVMKSAKVDPRIKDMSTQTKTNSRTNVINHKINSNTDSSDDLDIVSHFVDQSINYRKKCCSEDYTNETQIPSETSEESQNQALDKLQKSTKQWDIRVNSKDLKVESKNWNLENIKKLRIPTWRTGL